jgi:hypothetical protein
MPSIDQVLADAAAREKYKASEDDSDDSDDKDERKDSQTSESPQLRPSVSPSCPHTTPTGPLKYASPPPLHQLAPPQLSLPPSRIPISISTSSGSGSASQPPNHLTQPRVMMVSPLSQRSVEVLARIEECQMNGKALRGLLRDLEGRWRRGADGEME